MSSKFHKNIPSDTDAENNVKTDEHLNAGAVAEANAEAGTAENAKDAETNAAANSNNDAASTNAAPADKKKSKKNKKKKKLSKKSKIIIAIVIVAIVVTAIVIALIQVKRQHSKAYVQSVSDLNQGTWDIGDSTFDGTIVDEDAQTISVDDTKTVAEVYVKAGDTVTKGTPLLRYDSSDDDLTLESDQNDKDSAEEKLAMEKKLLDYYNSVTPVADPPSDAEQKKIDEAKQAAIDKYENDIRTNYPEIEITADTTDDTTDDASNSEDADDADSGADVPEPQAPKAVDSVSLSTNSVTLDLSDSFGSSMLIGGKVNPSDAKVTSVNWSSSDESIATVSDGYISAVKKGSCTITLTVNDKSASCAVTVNDSSENQTITKSEKQQKLTEIQSTIDSLNHDIKTGDITIQTDQQKIDDLTVTSLVDGVVKVASDPQNPPNDGTPFLSIGSANGVTVAFYVDENTYPTVSVGDSYTATDYMNGNTANATVTMISNYPSSDHNSDYDNRQNSYYKVTAVIDDGTGFNVDDSVSVQKASDASDDAIVLGGAYINKDGKGYFAVKDDGKGKLKKQYVKVKKISQYGSTMYEILDGLTNDDMIAFPYGKLAKEGTLTTTEQSFSLFGY